MNIIATANHRSGWSIAIESTRTRGGAPLFLIHRYRRSGLFANRLVAFAQAETEIEARRIANAEWSGWTEADRKAGEAADAAYERWLADRAA